MTWGCGEDKCTTIHSVSEERLIRRLPPSLLSVLGIAQDVTVQGFDRKLYPLMHAEILVASR